MSSSCINRPRWHLRLAFAMMIAAASVAWSQAGAPEPKPHQTANATLMEQQRMIDQLDQMDKMELQAELDRAQACTTRRDFPCTEKSLAKAARFTRGERDKAAVAQARANMQAEIERARGEESERLAGLERQRVASLRAGRIQQCEVHCPRPAQFRSCVDGRRDPGQCDDEEGSSLSVAQAVQDGLNSTLQSYGRVSQIHNDSIRQLSATLIEKDRAAQATARANAQAEQRRQLAAERDAALQLERDRERQERLAAQVAGARTSAAASGNTITQIMPPAAPVIAYPTKCPPGMLPSRSPATSPGAGYCIPDPLAQAQVNPTQGSGRPSDPQARPPLPTTSPPVVPSQAPSPVPVSGPSGCMSHSTLIPLGKDVCYASTMKQYLCVRPKNPGLEFVQRLSVKSSLETCFHVDRYNEQPARNNLAD